MGRAEDWERACCCEEGISLKEVSDVDSQGVEREAVRATTARIGYLDMES